MFEEIFHTNYSKPIFNAHHQFITGLNYSEETCIKINLLDMADMCEYAVIKFDQCFYRERLYKYSSLVFCKLIPNSSAYTSSFIFLSVIIIFLILLYAILLVTTFVPNVLAICNFVNISEHNSGPLIIIIITVLPEFLKTLRHPHNDSELLINELQGTALLTRTLVAGLIIFFLPISIYPPFYLRDEFFYMVAIVTISFIMIGAKVDRTYALFCLTTYLTYIIVAVLQEIYVKEKCHKIKMKILELHRYQSFVINETSRFLDASDYNVIRIIKKQIRCQKDMEKSYRIYDLMKPIHLHCNNVCQFGYGRTSNSFIFKQMFAILDPWKRLHRKNCKNWEKIILTIGFPVNIFLSLLVPVVNRRLPLQGWSKLLIIINSLLSPLIILKIYENVSNTNIFMIYIPIVMFVLCLFHGTRTDVAPPHHMAFAFLGTFFCIFLMDKLTNELSAIFNLIGVLCHLTGSAIVNLFMACANVIPDVVLSLTLSGMGYPRMAYASLVNRPILQSGMLTSLTIYMKTKNSDVDYLNVRNGSLGVTGMIFLFIELIFSFCTAVLLKFELRSSFGAFLVCIYIIFLMYIILPEMGFIHEYGTDHIDEHGINEDEGFEWA